MRPVWNHRPKKILLKTNLLYSIHSDGTLWALVVQYRSHHWLEEVLFASVKRIPNLATSHSPVFLNRTLQTDPYEPEKKSHTKAEVLKTHSPQKLRWPSYCKKKGTIHNLPVVLRPKLVRDSGKSWRRYALPCPIKGRVWRDFAKQS